MIIGPNGIQLGLASIESVGEGLVDFGFRRVDFSVDHDSMLEVNSEPFSGLSGKSSSQLTQRSLRCCA